MFNNKYQPYQPVPHCDSGDEIELNENTNQTSSSSSKNKITDLLKLTAHRRIRQRSQQSNTTDSIIHINDNSDTNTNSNTNTQSIAIHDRFHDIDLNNAHAHSDIDTNTDTDTCQSEGHLSQSNYDSYVFLLFLDGNKKRVGIMNSWRIWDLKDKYFKKELQTADNVRLIYRGKLLQDAVFINTYNIPMDGFIHVSISKNGGKPSYVSRMANNLDNSNTNYDNFDDGMDDEAMARMLQQREMNMLAGNNNNINNNNNNNGSNAWPNENDGSNAMDANRARREFLCGIFMGSVAGIWILIFLILAQRGGGYSRRFRLGVTLGVAINLMIQITYQYPNVNGNPSDGIDDATDNTTETEQQQQTEQHIGEATVSDT